MSRSSLRLQLRCCMRFSSYFWLTMVLHFRNALSTTALSWLLETKENWPQSRPALREILCWTQAQPWSAQTVFTQHYHGVSVINNTSTCSLLMASESWSAFTLQATSNCAVEAATCLADEMSFSSLAWPWTEAFAASQRLLVAAATIRAWKAVKEKSLCILTGYYFFRESATFLKRRSYSQQK